MKLWCEKCGQAVEPVQQRTYEIPDANASGYERIETNHCPFCGQEVWDIPDECAVCGELIAPFSTLCRRCAEYVDTAVNELSSISDEPMTRIVDAVIEYLEEKHG